MLIDRLRIYCIREHLKKKKKKMESRMMAVNMGIYSGCINSLIYPCLQIEIFLE
jgi:hypothetical protein